MEALAQGDLRLLDDWTGEEVVLPTFAGARKIAALRPWPDSAGPPPEVLSLRGRMEVADVEGVVPEYASAQRRYAGEERAAAGIAEIDVPGLRMARLALRPSWVGVLDFRTRFPGGTTAGEFQKRGR
ncbi:hypothetical protein [Actinoallomurus iriomotensis]|uniref:Uncharacterized protein n=1 Tax=Actinoallomurus iriomotensis TaxID=478107 RepID=A0A9W6VME8_9ACTN|nr:hypothetical protein [Actinoallomurus iriomotensis]GLY72397.1 hypothetical protein Airi01_006640 [Actinoallomurus iriomotensis]